MLHRLFIKNYALINELEIFPSPDLNIITGETGAGKSIILGAIGLLIGERADVKTLLNEQEKCVIEAEFQLKKLNLKSLFTEEELDYEEHTIIRREISPSGKSRAFINDVPCKLEQLKKIGSQLIDIHSQHQTILLNKSSFQFELLDTLADSTKEREQYRKTYLQHSKLIQEKERLSLLAKQQSTDLDYKNFILNELQSANLEEINPEKLEQQATLIENTEIIKNNLQEAVNILSGESEYTSTNTLFKSLSSLKQIESLNPKYQVFHSRLLGLLEELKDLSSELEQEQNALDYDPETALSIKETLNTYNSLSLKHHTKNIEELLVLQQNLQKELEHLGNSDAYLQQLDEQITLAYKQLTEAGNKLSEKRNEAIATIEQQAQQLLQYVGIKDGVFKIVLQTEQPTTWGMESIKFLFSANKGIAPESIEKVASGGELSRLMFCLKYITAQKTALPTVIFDEVDAGISGEIAQQMAKMMVRMGTKHQLITITHLPQMASKGSAHYYVFKDQSAQKSLSKIRLLSQEERIKEVAQMIGGANPSDSALKSAKELFA